MMGMDTCAPDVGATASQNVSKSTVFHLVSDAFDSTAVLVDRILELETRLRGPRPEKRDTSGVPAGAGVSGAVDAATAHIMGRLGQAHEAMTRIEGEVP